MLSDTSAAEPATNGSQPFLRHRDATLAYTGPDSDLTNLTEIRIGWFGPHDATNDPAADMWWAANLAVQEANEQPAPKSEIRNPKSEGSSKSEIRSSTTALHPGGTDLSRVPARLVPRWSTDPWGSGVSQLARMIYDEQLLAVIGSVDSASTHLAEQIVAKARLPLVSPVATDKSVTLAGVPWMFACAPADDAIARLLVDDLLRQLKADTDRFALMSGTDHESRLIAREVLLECSRHNRSPDFRFEFPPGALVVPEQLARLKQVQPSAVVIMAKAEDAARLVLALHEQLPDGQLYGSPSCGRSRFRELAGKAAEGVRFPLLFNPDTNEQGTVHFLERFRAEHGHEPDYTAALTYDATRLLLEAIRRAGPNRARIREALTQLSPWPGIAGPICFDGTGQNTRGLIRMGTIRGGCVSPQTPRLGEARN